VELVTGRTHQIRVHCQAEGHTAITSLIAPCASLVFGA
jgi:hypothetical protein